MVAARASRSTPPEPAEANTLPAVPLTLKSANTAFQTAAVIASAVNTPLAGVLCVSQFTGVGKSSHYSAEMLRLPPANCGWMPAEILSVADRAPEIIILTAPDAVSTTAKCVAAVVPAVQAPNWIRFALVNGEAEPVQAVALVSATRA